MNDRGTGRCRHYRVWGSGVKKCEARNLAGYFGVSFKGIPISKDIVVTAQLRQPALLLMQTTVMVKLEEHGGWATVQV